MNWPQLDSMSKDKWILRVSINVMPYNNVYHPFHINTKMHSRLNHDYTETLNILENAMVVLSNFTLLRVIEDVGLTDLYR